MIELPEIDERIYELFGDTDLIEGCLGEPGYRWTEAAYKFAEFSDMYQFERITGCSALLRTEGCQLL